MPYNTTPFNYYGTSSTQIRDDLAKANDNFSILASAFVSNDPTTGIVNNSNYANNSDKVDNFHASQTPTPNTIPVADSFGKLPSMWLYQESPYSRMTVGTTQPTSPNHNDLFYNTSTNALQKYDSRTNRWNTIDWQTIIKASPEFIAGRLRVNSTTGKLEISPNGTNWYECIPAVGSNVIELATIDNTGYSYKYWIAPGQTVIIRNANHIPVVYNSLYSSFFVDCRMNAVSGLLGLRPSNSTVSSHYQQLRASGGSVGSYESSPSIIGFSESGGVNQEMPCYFVLTISGTNFSLRSLTHMYGIAWLGIIEGVGTTPATSYWLGTLYNHTGTQFSVNYLTLTRKA